MQNLPSFLPLNDHSHYDLLNLQDEGCGVALGKEIYRKEIKGMARDLAARSFQNVIESIFNGTRLTDCDFSNTDFKDCVFKQSRFEKCKFNILTFATNTLSDCEFIECTFSDSTFQNCTFQRVRFYLCDFSKLLVKECRFVESIFDTCKTSNKLFELSLLINSRFNQTDIQIDTILSNFGIRAHDLDSSRIRSGRTDGNFDFISLEFIREASKQIPIAVPSLINVRLDFFEHGTMLMESIGLDQSLEVETWTKISSNLGSFIQSYRAFTDFLVLLYENDLLYWHSILKLHDLSGIFVHGSKGLPFETTTTIMGIHQQLSIYVEEVLLLGANIADEEGLHLEYVVEGPTDRQTVREVLSPLFEGSDSASITRLQPRNSPWQLGLDFLSNHHCFRAVIFLLATRVRAGIRKIQAQKVDKPIGKARSRSIESNEIAFFDVGLARGSKSVSGYGLSVLIPGKRVAELHLDFDSKKLTKIAAFLVAMDLTH